MVNSGAVTNGDILQVRYWYTSSVGYRITVTTLVKCHFKCCYWDDNYGKHYIDSDYDANVTVLNSQTFGGWGTFSAYAL